LSVIDPDAVHQAYHRVKAELAKNLEDEFRRLYKLHHCPEDGLDTFAAGRRRLKNVCLSFLNELDTQESRILAVRQFREARNMTDRIAALAAVVNSENPLTAGCLEDFYRQWRHDDLVFGKWLSLQATCRLPGTLDRVKSLRYHPAFDATKPNHIRSLIGAFSQGNPVGFHAKDGAGYAFLADHVIELNAINPQVAARLVTALTPWRRYERGRQALMRAQLQRIVAVDGISADVFEVASKSLA
jgi:aminopeptidase N